MKLPVLIQHFNEHKEKNSSLSIWEFLTMHYAHSDDHDGDNEKDTRLPFKSHDNCVNSIAVGFIANSSASFIAKPIPTENIFCGFYSENFSLTSYRSSIWQPPKFFN